MMIAKPIPFDSYKGIKKNQLTDSFRLLLINIILANYIKDVYTDVALLKMPECPHFSTFDTF